MFHKKLRIGGRRRSVERSETYNGNEPAVDHGKRCPIDGQDSRFCPDILVILNWLPLFFIINI